MITGCWFRDENGDICGETYTCRVCRSEKHVAQVEAAIADERGSDRQSIDLLRSQVADLQNVVRLLAWHIHRELKDPDAKMELAQELDGTPMML